MPKYGFALLADPANPTQQTQIGQVIAALGALIEGRDADEFGAFHRYVLKGVTVPSTDKEGNPIPGGIEVEAGCAVMFPSQVSRVRIGALTTQLVGDGGLLPMATVVETGDAANDALVERHLKVELMSQGCERWWGPLDRTSTIPAPPIPLSNFVELTL